jgi:hypothetical protein
MSPASKSWDLTIIGGLKQASSPNTIFLSIIKAKACWKPILTCCLKNWMQKGRDLSLVEFPFSETHSCLSQEHGTKKCIHVRLPLMVRTCKLSSNVKDLVLIWSSRPIRLHNWFRTYKAGPSVNQPLRSHLDIEGGFGHFDYSLLCSLRAGPSETVYWIYTRISMKFKFKYIMQFEPANMRTISHPQKKVWTSWRLACVLPLNSHPQCVCQGEDEKVNCTLLLMWWHK